MVGRDEDTRVIVVDGGSTDGTVQIAHGFGVDVIHSPSKGFSVQRNLGAQHSTTSVLGFIDADMILGDTVISEVRSLFASQNPVGVVIPEVSFGSTYWANVRSFERSFYSGEQSPEAARFFLKSVFEGVGGYDERLSSMEDFALDRAARKVGPIVRAEATILHDEGELYYLQACKRKANYAGGIVSYSKLYGRSELGNFLLNRDYLRRPYRLLRRPFLGAGVIALKLGEAVAVGTRLLRNRIVSRN